MHTLPWPQCPSQHDTYQEYMNHIHRKLQALKTEPGITRLILQILGKQDIQYTGTEKNEKWIQQLITEQEQIGLNNFHRGCLT